MSDKTKLTLWVEKELINKAKHYALDANKSLSEVIEELLRQILNR